MISVFDIYKIGIGPSSSHTVGPMKAGKQFCDDLIEKGLLNDVTRVVVDVYGSLSLTGKGHHTDLAIIMGLAGNLPDSVDIDSIPGFIKDVETRDRLLMANGQHEVAFPLETSMNFHEDNLSLHENGMRITALAGDKVLYSKTYYSIGGGFIVDEEHFGQQSSQQAAVPYPYNSAADLQRHCKESGLSLSGLVMQNELALHSKDEIAAHFSRVWDVMRTGIERGINTEGVLPGPLRVPRRASALRRMLVTNDKTSVDPMAVVDWINMFAFAVNEENAAGGRVVTAPTNGACGIIPAVLAYYDKFIREVNANSYTRYFLASGVIGTLYKMNASISGAEVGCQGEVGVACSMAAAGLAELLGGSPAQVCMAAEIAMEHNLGLTCDPVAGQVQVPCIERNAIAAVKAVNAARMALRRTSDPRVCLDKVIETMYETGKDMNAKYRETSRGGLALKVLSCG
ncbi:L-serine ammonia-lyase [Edwardsiella piscicida]|uniref:L-serine ammonia-lyase n=1 Tax=Edwardsiella piscicida TaxID=1263550 RepID=UPI0002C127FF|nr:L-serine ammonia-lyase [Edwardsiella piscicida]AGH74263.1 L-serine dehydratase [Edwardsiella piscicida C07-087]EKS7780821.1 L-serine ammonia-lyase [Edwardsiella piscicida]EKS7784832.1 L-serine ammonia-lyase [Edwardsiella piscicida]UCQ23301.1 L-serine ammonia-lyase [Edwardsiella piscicida]UCQ33507.1 L-serine ammonia-lyase [Edwardsiella piscicida]